MIAPDAAPLWVDMFDRAQNAHNFLLRRVVVRVTGSVFVNFLAFISFALFPFFIAAGNIFSLAYIFLAVGIVYSRGLNDWKRFLAESRYFLWPYLGVFSLILIACLYGDASKAEKTEHIIKAMRFLSILAIGCALYQSDRLRWCLAGFFAAMAVIVISMYLSVYIILPWAPYVPLGWGGDHTMFGDYITQNIMVSFFCVYMLHYVVTGDKLIFRAVATLFFCMALFAVTLLSYGRTGYLMVIGSVAAYFLVYAKGVKKKIALILFMSILVVAAYSLSDGIRSRVDMALREATTSTEQGITSVGGRLVLWKNSFGLMAEKPLLGYGTGGYHVAWCTTTNSQEWCDFGKTHPHNQFLFFGVDGGIILLLAYLSVFVAPLLYMRKYGWEKNRLMIPFLFILMIDSLFNAPFWNVREAHFFTMIGGLMWAILLRNARGSAVLDADVPKDEFESATQHFQLEKNQPMAVPLTAAS